MSTSFSRLITSVVVFMALSCGSKGQESGNGNTGGSGYVIQTGGTGSDIDGGSNGGGTTCAQQQVPLKVLPPDILIIQDRSQSMTDNSNDKTCTGGCGAASKWAQVTTAIEDVVNSTQNSVNWGLFYFSNGVTECGVNTTPAVSVSLGNASQIVTSLTANSPSGATPTTATVNNAVAYMQTLTDPNPKYLLLATDGEPNCLGGNANNKDIAGATAAIDNAKSLGFPVFVVGIGNVTTATSTLNGMANAGGKAQAGTTAYYAVTDTASLETALTNIVGMVSSCTISLQNVPSGQWTIAIWATDSSGKTIQIQNSASDGWAYTDTNKSSIALVGPICDNLKNGTYSNIQFVYTCQDQVINPPVN
jgi:hypothetical protein